MSKLTAVAYYGGIPSRNSNPEKPMILDNFLEGVRASGDNAIGHKGMNAIPCDVALIQGFVHEHGKSAPHLLLRRAATDLQKQHGKRALIVDSNLFLYADPGNSNHYLRYSFDGVFPTTGFYFDKDVDPQRWVKISKNLNLSLKPWRTSGSHLVLCLQRNGGWSMKGKPVSQWMDETINKIRSFGINRHIVVRPHPGDKKWRNYVKITQPNVSISTKPNIRDDLGNAWAMICHNSSPSVASIIEGIPAFITDPEPQYSQSFEVANTNLKRLEDPRMPDRQAWIEKLAMCHWNFDELRSGEAWRFFKKYVT